MARESSPNRGAEDHLHAEVEAIISRDRSRLQHDWNSRTPALRSRMREIATEAQKAAGDDAIDPKLLAILEGLEDEMVLEASYVAAAKLGQEAVPGYTDKPIDPYALGQAHAAYRRPYAGAAVQRMALELDDFAESLGAAEDLAAIYASIDEKLAAIASDVTRYADPTWATAQAGYGNQLGQFEVRMIWVLDDDASHCEDCPDLADESEANPWTVDEVPTWPAFGDTQCLDRCRCHIEPEAGTFASATSS